MNALRHPRGLLAAGSALALCSFFALPWIDLLFLRYTGFDLAKDGSIQGGKTLLLWIVVAAALLGAVAAARRDRLPAIGAGFVSLLAIGALGYGWIVASEGTSFMGQKISLVGFLAIGYWAAACGLALMTAGSFLVLRSDASTDWASITVDPSPLDLGVRRP